MPVKNVGSLTKSATMKVDILTGCQAALDAMTRDELDQLSTFVGEVILNKSKRDAVAQLWAKFGSYADPDSVIKVPLES